MASGGNPISSQAAEKCGDVKGVESFVSMDEDSGSIVVTYQHNGFLQQPPFGNRSHNLYYVLGDMKGATMRITWGSEKTCDRIVGQYPKISLLKSDKKTVVVVYSWNTQCYCRMGTMTEKSIVWNDTEHVIDEGIKPSLTASEDNTVVVTFITNGRAYTRVGVIRESSDIEWKSDKCMFAEGVDDVAISMNKSKDIVVAYSKASTSLSLDGTTLCKVGKIKDGQVRFGGESTEIKGHYPSVSINDRGLILLMFQQTTFLQNLFIQCGVLQQGTKAITWMNEDTRKDIDHGRNPSVYLMNNGQFIEVHDGFVSLSLFFRTGEIKSDRNII